MSAVNEGTIYGGVRIVELTSGIAAPYASMFLADHGAEVIKVEPSSGDWYRSEPGFETFNRNKQSVVVEDPTDLDALEPLLVTADVVIVDRPGCLDRLRDLAPGAIVVAMSPWGERGPLSGAPSSPALVAAATGVAWKQQSYGEVPVHVVVPITSYGTAVLGALAIGAALFARERSGEVARLEVSEAAGSGAVQIGDTRLGDEIIEQPGSSTMGSKGRVPCYRLFEARDGRWLFVACGTTRFYERLLELIDRRDLLAHPDLPSPPWGLLNDEAIAVLAPILEDVFATRDREDWLDALRAADVPAQPVLTRAEFLETSIVSANELDVSVDHPVLEDLQMMGMPLVMEAAPGSIRSHAPLLGSTSLADAIRSGTPRASRDLATAPPLSGIGTVDLSSFIAGPVVSRHLAMLGAEVVKVEPPGGDPFRGLGPMFANWNQGKRSIVLDLQDDGDRMLLSHLAVQSDVVVENFRPGVAARLGVDETALRSANPDLVILSSPGYGDDVTMADAPAFDPLLQALGGIMAAQGGEVEPVFLSVPVHDVITPLLSAFGVVSGLWHRERTGRGQRVRTSLAHAAMAAQAAEYTRFVGAAEPEVGGFDFGGNDPMGWREESDGSLWFFDGDVEVEIARDGLVNTEIAIANGLVVTHDHPALGPLTQVGQLVGGVGVELGRSPLLDEHGPQIRAALATAATVSGSVRWRDGG